MRGVRREGYVPPVRASRALAIAETFIMSLAHGPSQSK
jgi:hypothetical protein